MPAVRSDIKGIVVPLLIPYSENGDIALDVLKQEIDYVITRDKAHAVVAGGTSIQEVPLLTPSERKLIIEATVEYVKGRVPVLAGISDNTLSGALGYAKIAQDAGADVLVAMPPFSAPPGPPTRDEIFAYYQSLSEKVELPILAYNPATVIVDMPLDLLKKIAELKMVRYIKETSRNMNKLTRLIVSLKDKVGIFTTMDVLLPTLQLGAIGAVIPSPASKLGVQIYEAFIKGDLSKAAELQSKFAIFPPDLGKGFTPIFKEAMNLLGIKVGRPRAPFLGLSDAEREIVKQSLKASGIMCT
jgi:4-hydroxy-tetrahydrodipicolinate synthase